MCRGVRAGSLWDGAVGLRLVLGQSRLILGEQGGPAPLGLEELLRGHQVTVALRVREGVAGAAGAVALGVRAAWGRSQQGLLTCLVPHLHVGGAGGRGGTAGQ